MMTMQGEQMFCKKEEDSMTGRMRSVSQTKLRKAAAALIVLILAAVIALGIAGGYRAGASDGKKTYYTSIKVEQGETLWEIAERYAGSDSAADIAEYVRMLTKLNGLKDADCVRSGSYLTVTYRK